MTTINDISDLIRILRDNPAWAEAVRSVLLSQELLKLPEEFAVLAKNIKENAETVNRRLESLEAGQQRLEAGQQQLEANQAQLLNTVNGMRGELGNLSGSFFQRRAANFADRVARRDFRLRQTSLIHHADQVGDSRLKPILDEAVDDASNTFTENDAASVEQADAVIAGKAPDGSDTYLVVETSITVVKDDVDRARDRAELLERATGAGTHALVIGEAITTEAAAQAKDRTVTFAAFTPRRTTTQQSRPA